jgi:hypothetical protein
MQTASDLSTSTDLCEDCARRETARAGAGWFTESLARDPTTCESCGLELDACVFHPDPDAHRSG